MKKDRIISICMWILAFIVVIGLFYLIKPSGEPPKEGICVIKQEAIQLDYERSKEHRGFCFEKDMKPIYPEREITDCFMPCCYQESCFIIFCSCDVDMSNEVWCYDTNQEIRRFRLNETGLD